MLNRFVLKGTSVGQMRSRIYDL